MSLLRQISFILIATIVIACSIGYIAWQKKNQFITAGIEDFQNIQLTFVRQVSQRVELSFANLKDDLFSLSQIPDVQFLTPNNCLLNMIRVQKLNSSQIDTLYRTDATGAIRYSYPATKAPIDQAQFQQIFDFCRLTGKTQFQTIRTNMDGSDQLIIALPVYTVQGSVHLNPSNKFAGILFFTTSLTKLNDYFFSASFFGEKGYPWIVSSEKLIISTANQSHLGKKFKEFLPEELSRARQGEILTILDKMVEGKSGTGRYTYSLHSDIQDHFTKLTAYTPLHLPDQTWSIAVSNTLAGVLKPLEKSIGELYYYAICLIAAFAVMAAMIIQLLRNNHSKQLKALQKKEEENKRIRNEWQVTFDSVDSMVFLLDETFKILRANKAAINIRNCSSDLIIGQNLATILREQTSHTFELISSQGDSDMEIVSQKIFFPTSATTFLMTLVPVNEPEHDADHVCYLKDISEMEKLQDNYNRAQKMESIGLVTGGVAHDLNNILSGLVSYPELILMRLPDNSEFRRPIEMIKTSGDRAAAIVNDLLTVTRGVACVKSTENLNELITSFLQSTEFQNIQKEHPGVQFLTELNPDLLPIECSPIHVQKCLMNLFTNSSEAIQGIGHVIINTKNIYYSKSTTNSKETPTKDQVVLTVSDSGKGISNEDKKRIFEPFYTKKIMGKSGTGLGLTVVWNTMENHEGSVEVISDKNGSSFVLSFPSTDSQTEPQEESVFGDLRDVMGNGERILIVDDEELQRDIARQMLTTLEYQATSVQSGEEALVYLKANRADLVLLDMVMDPGINGCETYEKILRINPEQKAVIASGFSENVLVKRALLLGAGALIRKPYTMRQIGSAVKSTLGRSLDKESYVDESL